MSDTSTPATRVLSIDQTASLEAALAHLRDEFDGAFTAAEVIDRFL